MDFEKVVSVKNMRESDARTIAERTFGRAYDESGTGHF